MNVQAERFVAGSMGGELIEAAQEARYRLAAGFVEGKRVLDAGCGTGWGPELLLAAGAASVIGIDSAAEAIDQCRKRVEGGAFIEGDLQVLPFGAGMFDVVVCFEALAGTSNAEQALDDLVRVLDSSGLLFVSSPNPGVHPGGEPRHSQELSPAELVEAVRAKLPNVALIQRDGDRAPTRAGDELGEGVLGCSVLPTSPVLPGADPYSLVIGTSGGLPDVQAVQALSPSRQLQNRDSLPVGLSVERARITEDHAGTVAEHQHLLDVLTEAEGRLASASEDLSRIAGERDAALRRLVSLQERCDRIATERDRFAMALLRVEQELAAVRGVSSQVEVVPEDEGQVKARLEEVMAYAADLERELEAHRATISWRVTRPLRRFRIRLKRLTP